MRTFVAVFPPLEIREALVGAARELPVTGEVRPILPANIHLTLKFLGDVSEGDLDRVAEALDQVRRRHQPFEAGFSGFGAFPSTRRARILWAGIGEGADRLRALARDVEASLGSLGFEREARAYLPHLTVGRARGRPVAMETTEALSPLPSFSVRRMELVQSVLDAAGVTYSTLADYPLSEDRD